MKKLLVAILAIVYLAVSSGVAMSIHYCMGKISSVDLMHTGDKCSKCGMKKTDGCCKDEFKIVKLSDSHKLISNEINISTPVAIIENASSLFDAQAYSSVSQLHYNNHSPPPPDVSLNILYCVFRI
jgi:hypothetical protein